MRADDEQVEAGYVIVSDKCASCHAIGVSGDSPNTKAPPFRTLSSKYELDALSEALAEGIVTGHEDMPQFAFEPMDIGAILSYLASISDKPD